MINHFLSIIPIKIHSDQFQGIFFWLGLVFLKVIVQYKIHTTIFNFGNLQKKDFKLFKDQARMLLTLHSLCCASTSVKVHPFS